MTRDLDDLLADDAILLAVPATDRDDAVRRAGAALQAVGAVDDGYTAAMLEREAAVSTYVGEGVAMPHGTLAAAEGVRRDALCVLRLADPVEWGGPEVSVVIGIAAQGNGHIALLARLAAILLDPERAAALRGAATAADVRRALAPDDS